MWTVTHPGNSGVTVSISEGSRTSVRRRVHQVLRLGRHRNDAAIVACPTGTPLSAHCGEAAPRSEMPVLEQEQGPPPAGATERTLLDH